MLVYLDSAQNRKGQPNENFAREVMELFTLGEGHYSEQDIKEAARAFTGWSLDRETGEYLFRPGCTTTASRPCSAKRAASTATRCSTSCSRSPQTAEFITGKLWREFVSPDPDPREVQRIAQAFRESQLRHQGRAARAAAERRVLGAARIAARWSRAPSSSSSARCASSNFAARRRMPFVVVAAGMGQNLFSPPNVKGWPGGEPWINTTTLLARKQFVDRLARADDATAVDDRSRDAGLAVPANAAVRPTPLSWPTTKRRASSAWRAMRSRLAQRATSTRRAWLAARSRAPRPTDKDASAQALLLAVAAARGRADPTTTRSRSSARRCSTPSINSSDGTTLAPP